MVIKTMTFECAQTGHHWLEKLHVTHAGIESDQDVLDIPAVRLISIQDAEILKKSTVLLDIRRVVAQHY